MARTWLSEIPASVAAERILDAAGRCFARAGVRATSVGDVAREAGCSRPTVYRYFEDRQALRTAFAHREARRLGHAVRHTVAGIEDPAERLVEAVMAALRGVRSDPTLAAWYGAADAATAGALAGSSDVIHSLAAGFVGRMGSEAIDERARWVVRVTVSLLAHPGRDDADERAMLHRFLVPAILGG
jgi:AcrR family transcriptional regulator